MRTTAGIALALGFLALGSAGAMHPAPQGGGEDEIEDFEDEDPYTRGKKERLERLGYASLGGPFLFLPGEQTTGVRETLGGIEVLWVETPHFKLGSTLGTYRLPNDQDERGRVERELRTLKKRMGSMRSPGKELDPWIRLHLYAQRLEELYADFCERFGLDESDFPPGAPHLGQREKFVVLLCEKKSSIGRFLKRYAGIDEDYSYRWELPGGGLFYCVSAEALVDTADCLDSAVHCSLASSIAQNFADAYRENHFTSPTWFRIGLGHWYSRRVDPRYTPAIGYEGREREEGDWEWEERVRNLVGNDFFASTGEMLGWKEYGDLDVRDHMVAWSKVDYLLGLEEGDRELFLDALLRPPPAGEAAPDEAARKAKQVRALAEGFGLSPAELDEDWAKHVRRNYR